ncbi:hypothetical protein D3C73_700210 [compost metagenome]
MGEHHAQGQQQVRHGRPAPLAVVVLPGVAGLLQVVHDLPDPRRRTHRATEERQRDTEHHPRTVLECGPAGFGVGNRLAVRQGDDRVGVGFEQRGDGFTFDCRGAEPHVGHLAEQRARLHQQLANGPDGRQLAGENILRVVETNAVRQPGQDGLTQCCAVLDCIQQVRFTWILQQRMLKQRSVEQAGPFGRQAWPDDKHVGDRIRRVLGIIASDER